MGLMGVLNHPLSAWWLMGVLIHSNLIPAGSIARREREWVSKSAVGVDGCPDKPLGLIRVQIGRLHVGPIARGEGGGCPHPGRARGRLGARG